LFKHRTSRAIASVNPLEKHPRAYIAQSPDTCRKLYGGAFPASPLKQRRARDNARQAESLPRDHHCTVIGGERRAARRLRAAQIVAMISALAAGLSRLKFQVNMHSVESPNLHDIISAQCCGIDPSYRCITHPHQRGPQIAAFTIEQTRLGVSFKI